MNRIGRMKKNIRISALMSALIITMIACGIMFTLITLHAGTRQYKMLLIITAVILLINVILAFLYSTKKISKIMKRIRLCKATRSVDHETYERIAKEIAMGEEWLIYHCKNDYLFWTKQTVISINVVKDKDLFAKGKLIIQSKMRPNGEEIFFTESTRENIEHLVNWMV